MKEIKLNHGYVTLVDDEDFEYLNQWKWQLNKTGNCIYVDRITTTNKIRKVIKMHRLIMNTPKDMQVDHIDHNGLNNQKNNLRNCSVAQNRMNRKPSGTTKYLGVRYNYRNKIIALTLS